MQPSVQPPVHYPAQPPSQPPAQPPAPERITINIPPARPPTHPSPQLHPAFPAPDSNAELEFDQFTPEPMDVDEEGASMAVNDIEDVSCS